MHDDKLFIIKCWNLLLRASMGHALPWDCLPAPFGGQYAHLKEEFQPSAVVCFENSCNRLEFLAKFPYSLHWTDEFHALWNRKCSTFASPKPRLNRNFGLSFCYVNSWTVLYCFMLVWFFRRVSRKWLFFHQTRRKFGKDFYYI